MRLGGLSLFTKTNSRGLFNLAAYHSPHSLTWSWIVSVKFDGVWRRPSGWPRFGVWAHRDNQGLQVSVTLPFMVFSRHVQEPMWYRNLFARARDREDALEEQNRKLRRALTVARASALTSVDQGRPQ